MISHIMPGSRGPCSGQYLASKPPNACVII
jgi:hypothetical protein